MKNRFNLVDALLDVKHLGNGLEEPVLIGQLGVVQDIVDKVIYELAA